MVFTTLVSSYLTSTLLKINAEQIIKLSSPNLGKSFALIVAGGARASKFGEPPALSGLAWRGGRRRTSGSRGKLGLEAPGGPTWDGQASPRCRPQDLSGARGACPGPGAAVLVTGPSGPPVFHVCAESRKHTPRRTAILTVCRREPVSFVSPQKGPVTGLKGPPAPAEHDSFRQLLPQARLVPVLATSAGQVVRSILGLGGTCPGAPADPPPAGPGRLPPEAAPEQRMAISRCPQEALLSPSWARPGPAPHPRRAGPGLSNLFRTEQSRVPAGASGCRHWPSFRERSVPGCAHWTRRLSPLGPSTLASEVVLREGVHTGLGGEANESFLWSV